MATRNTIKGLGEKKTKNQRTIWAWVNWSVTRLSCDTLHSLRICRLTLAWVSSAISTKLLGMPMHLDWSSITAARPYPISCRLVSQMSGVDCPLPLSFARRQLLPLGSFFQLRLAFRCLLPVASKSRVQAFVWFRTKTKRDRLLSGPPT